MIAKKVLLIRLVVRKILNNNMMFENNIHRKPITGRGGPINEIGIAIQIFQISYIVLTVIIIGKETTRRRRRSQTIKER
jgi:hypothetical protein